MKTTRTVCSLGRDMNDRYSYIHNLKAAVKINNSIKVLYKHLETVFNHLSKHGELIYQTQ